MMEVWFSATGSMRRVDPVPRLQDVGVTDTGPWSSQ